MKTGMDILDIRGIGSSPYVSPLSERQFFYCLFASLQDKAIPYWTNSYINGAPVAKKLQAWHTDLTLETEIFSIVNEVPLHTAFYYHPHIVLIFLKYCLKRRLIVKSSIRSAIICKHTSNKAPGRVAQSVGHLTRKSGVLSSIPGLATYFRFSFRFFKKVVSYWRKYVHEVLVNRLRGLSLPVPT